MSKIKNSGLDQYSIEPFEQQHFGTADTLVLGMVEGERQPGRPGRRWIDDVLMWCDKDIKGAVMMRRLEKIRRVYRPALTVLMQRPCQIPSDKPSILRSLALPLTTIATAFPSGLH